MKMKRKRFRYRVNEERFENKSSAFISAIDPEEYTKKQEIHNKIIQEANKKKKINIQRKTRAGGRGRGCGRSLGRGRGRGRGGTRCSCYIYIIYFP